MAKKSMRIRKIARLLRMPEEELVAWLRTQGHGGIALHPANFLPVDVLDRARVALDQLLEPRCDACRKAPVLQGRRIIPAGPETPCARCAGSVACRAALDLVDAFRARGFRRLVVVGGSPTSTEQLRAELGPHIELRIVDGTSSRHLAERASADLAWADLVGIWGSTILPHKVSMQYTDRTSAHRGKVVTVHSRGVSSFCAEIARRLAPAARRRGG